MKLTWLGQGGCYIETNSINILIDPYFSDLLRELCGDKMRRLTPMDPAFWDIRPDMIVITHDHQDHMDMPALQKFLSAAEKPITVLSSRSAWKPLKNTCGGPHNYVQLAPETEWTQSGVQVRGLTAVHSDPAAIGLQITAEGKTIYQTGDTLYTTRILRDLTAPVDLMITVMHGRGNNMNAYDAARLVKQIAPKAVVPVHWGMFEEPADTPADFAGYLTNSGIAVHIPTVFHAEEFDDYLQSNV